MKARCVATEAPAMAMGTIYQALGHSTAMMFENSVNSQQQQNMLQQLDEDVEEMLLQIADDFSDHVVNASCQIAKHRKSNTVEARDVQLHLERNWNMWLPGFGNSDDSNKNLKKSTVTEAHKQRMALIRKTMKKF